MRCILFLCLLLTSCSTGKLNRYSLTYTQPIVSIEAEGQRKTSSSFLQHNPTGLWEMYAEGAGLQLGLVQGALLDSLYRHQEEVFFKQVQTLVPGKTRQWLLRKVLSFYNRKLPNSVLPEFRDEIYGLSRYASDSLNFIAKPYPRALYLHAAHDIGHAMQDLALVGCTSFAVWGEKTVDGDLLIGRNFDFYAGDEFAENRLLAFIRPDHGFPFASVSWPGMTGVVSGMNAEGLSVSLNAGKSNLPLKARTPVSLLAREILQFASTIAEAKAIAEKRRLFVSESLMIGSAKDRKAILLEISPKKMGVHEVENSLVCTNHFQSAVFAKDKNNQKQRAESHSLPRLERVNELLQRNPPLRPETAADILRDTFGPKDTYLGLGNDRAINHLLAHHAVLFEPNKKRIWVSAPPYNIGPFLAYDLEKIFATKKIQVENSIAADPFLTGPGYAQYEEFRLLHREIEYATQIKKALHSDTIDRYITLNPELWLVYYQLGQYFDAMKQKERARTFYERALGKVLPSEKIRTQIQKRL
jgi:hypothetical protein